MHSHTVEEHHTRTQHPVEELLYSFSNKASLIKFQVDEWKVPKYREKLEDKLLYVPVRRYAARLPRSIRRKSQN